MPVVYEPHQGGWLAWPPVRPEPVVTLTRTVADVLVEHVVFKAELIDRTCRYVYVPC